jgi:hypothetical protein
MFDKNLKYKAEISGIVAIQFQLKKAYISVIHKKMKYRTDLRKRIKTNRLQIRLLA